MRKEKERCRRSGSAEFRREKCEEMQDESTRRAIYKGSAGAGVLWPS